jgi:hypothetical protein
MSAASGLSVLILWPVPARRRATRGLARMGPQGAASWKCTCILVSYPYNDGMRKTFTQTLRAAIRKSSKTRYVIAKESGVSEATLSRFVHGSDMRTDTVDYIVDALELELKPRPRRKGK